jgi:V-type H+-transporting ATPase subunit H
MLVMLVAGDDEDVATIACYDIGEFVRHYPNGRAIAKRLGAKDIIMQLIEHDNEELRRHSLLCVSKMMVQNWAVRLIGVLTARVKRLY